MLQLAPLTWTAAHRRRAGRVAICLAVCYISGEPTDGTGHDGANIGVARRGNAGTDPNSDEIIRLPTAAARRCP